MNRRSILKALAAAPAAIPVVAKEAAARAGLSSMASAGAMTAGTLDKFGGYPADCSANAPAPMDARSHLRWIDERLLKLRNGDGADYRRHQAEQQACRLNVNRAALVSMSPAAAYATQVDECERRLLQQEIDSIERDRADWIKHQGMSLLKGLIG